MADREGRGRLLAGFGVSLFERAVIDAFCRRHEIAFADVLRHKEFGIELGAIHPGLGAAALASCMRREPLRQVTVRHTIGLADHLTEGDIPNVDRVRDGLPESLEASIRHYGLTHFKAKLSGDADGDLERLRRIVHVLGRLVGDYRLTLDGNEQYAEMSRFRDFWETLDDDPVLRPAGDHVLFVEQPVARDDALTEAAAASFEAWPDRPPIIIDEFDDSLDSARTALRLGYAGTSHMNCQGVFKGVANAALIASRQQAGKTGLILSGEDLATLPPTAFGADLAVLAALGVPLVERNGHHYLRGLSMFPDAVGEEMRVHQPDLFRRDGSGLIRLDIREGSLRLDTVNGAPFGRLYAPRPELLTPPESWDIDDLDG